MAFILNLENPFQSLEPEAERLFAMETEYMAAPGFFQTGNSNLRRAAQRAMRRLSETPGFVHDPLVPFLALNYYDRSISRERIPDEFEKCLDLLKSRFEPPVPPPPTQQEEQEVAIEEVHTEEEKTISSQMQEEEDADEGKEEAEE